MATLPIRDHPPLRAPVFTLHPQLSRPQGNDGGTRSLDRSYNDLPVGLAPRHGLEKRCRPHLRPTNDSYLVDETYMKIKGKWPYLYRVVDSTGQTIDFILSARRDASAAKRFFRKMLKAASHSSPRVINVDKNRAYPLAVEQLKEEGTLPNRTQLRQSKYLNNLIEQDHRFIKRRINPGLGFFSFKTAGRTIKGYEAMQMVRKGQIEGVGKGDVKGQVRFVESLFQVAA